jgi:hypothetical protein
MLMKIILKSGYKAMHVKWVSSTTTHTDIAEAAAKQTGKEEKGAKKNDKIVNAS